MVGGIILFDSSPSRSILYSSRLLKVSKFTPSPDTWNSKKSVFSDLYSVSQRAKKVTSAVRPSVKLSFGEVKVELALALYGIVSGYRTLPQAGICVSTICQLPTLVQPEGNKDCVVTILKVSAISSL